MAIQKYDGIPEGAKKAKIWFNGKLINWDDATIHIATHALNYGVAAFEGIRVYKPEECNQECAIIWHLDEHLKRLGNSIKKAGLKPTATMEEIKQGCIDVVKSAKGQSGYIRPQIMFGLSKLSLASTTVTDSYVLFWPMGKYRDTDGLTLVSSKVERMSPNAADIKAKIMGFYTNSHFNHEYAKKHNADDAIMLDVQGNVSEASSANIFIVKKGILKTPKLGFILEGITRKSVLQLAKDLSIPVEETTLSFEDLKNADEMFLTGTAAEIEPVIKYDATQLSVGEITIKLKERFDLAKQGKLKEYDSWYTKGE